MLTIGLMYTRAVCQPGSLRPIDIAIAIIHIFLRKETFSNDTENSWTKYMMFKEDDLVGAQINNDFVNSCIVNL